MSCMDHNVLGKLFDTSHAYYASQVQVKIRTSETSWHNRMSVDGDFSDKNWKADFWQVDSGLSSFLV